MRFGALHNAGGDGEEDEDRRLAKDVNNVEINQQWRHLNYGHKSVPSNMPIRFGVHDDDEDDEAKKGDNFKETSQVSVEDTEDLIDDFIKLVDESEVDCWEDEIDPYAFESRHIRRRDWEKYCEYKKPFRDEQNQRLQERAERENMFQAEVRRMRNEAEKKRAEAKQEKENAAAAAAPGKSILEQFKEKKQKEKEQEWREKEQGGREKEQGGRGGEDVKFTNHPPEPSPTQKGSHGNDNVSSQKGFHATGNVGVFKKMNNVSMEQNVDDIQWAGKSNDIQWAGKSGSTKGGKKQNGGGESAKSPERALCDPRVQDNSRGSRRKGGRGRRGREDRSDAQRSRPDDLTEGQANVNVTDDDSVSQANVTVNVTEYDSVSCASVGDGVTCTQTTQRQDSLHPGDVRPGGHREIGSGENHSRYEEREKVNHSHTSSRPEKGRHKEKMCHDDDDGYEKTRSNFERTSDSRVLPLRSAGLLNENMDRVSVSSSAAGDVLQTQEVTNSSLNQTKKFKKSKPLDFTKAGGKHGKRNLAHDKKNMSGKSLDGKVTNGGDISGGSVYPESSSGGSDLTHSQPMDVLNNNKTCASNGNSNPGYSGYSGYDGSDDWDVECSQNFPNQDRVQQQWSNQRLEATTCVTAAELPGSASITRADLPGSVGKSAELPGTTRSVSVTEESVQQLRAPKSFIQKSGQHKLKKAKPLDFTKSKKKSTPQMRVSSDTFS